MNGYFFSAALSLTLGIGMALVPSSYLTAGRGMEDHYGETSSALMFFYGMPVWLIYLFLFTLFVFFFIFGVKKSLSDRSKSQNEKSNFRTS